MSSAATADTAPEVELNDFGQPKRSPCVQPTFTLAEYLAECGPCGPDTPHGALWRELAVAATEHAIALPPSPRVVGEGGPMLMSPIVDEPRLSKKRSTMDSAILGKRMLVMLVVPEKRDAAVAEVRQLIAGEDLAEAAAWAFHEVGIFTLAAFGHAGWWHEETARDLGMYRTASEHILNEVKSSFSDR